MDEEKERRVKDSEGKKIQAQLKKIMTEKMHEIIIDEIN